jgi:hypothetical protein
MAAIAQVYNFMLIPAGFGSSMMYLVYNRFLSGVIKVLFWIVAK